MQTATKKIKIQDSEVEAIKWLEEEYPRGIELTYIDYMDRFEDAKELEGVLKLGYFDGGDDWLVDGQYESVQGVIRNYRDEIGVDLSDEVQEAMSDWLFDHDTSDPVMGLLRNTSRQLCYIETPDHSEEDKSNAGQLLKKYGKTAEQRADIKYVLSNQFYGAPVSFYFYADMERLFDAINRGKGKYIRVEGAYFSTIDRIQGSNWLGQEAIFALTIPRKDFVEALFLDKAKGNGYGWDEIAGQAEYDDAEVFATDTNKRGSILLAPEISEDQKREARLQKHWDEVGECTFGDMNFSRHKDKPYRNEYPCGNKCVKCGTFWID